MSSTTVPGVIARPVRGAVQGGLAFTVTEFLDSFFFTFTDRQYGALVALLAVVFSFLQVVIENAIGAGFFRRVPERNVPAIDAGPEHRKDV